MNIINSVSYSILELATISKEKTTQNVFADSVELAQKAEEYGYKRIWFAEHHNMPSIMSNASPVLIGHIAQATNTLRIGSGGVMLPNHSPLIVAEQFGTLGTLFPDRIDLGLGRAPGADQETIQAIRPNFAAAAHSFPEDIEKIQRYFSIKNKSSSLRVPVAEGVDVPLFILGASPNSAYLAAEKGLPYAFASHFSTSHFRQAIKTYRDNFQPVNGLKKPYVLAAINVFVADTDKEAERLYTSNLKFVLGILTGAKNEFVEEPSEMTKELQEVRRHPQISQVIKYTFIGSKKTVKDGIEDFLNENKIDEIITSSTFYDSNDRLRSLKLFSEIMRELNQSK